MRSNRVIEQSGCGREVNTPSMLFNLSVLGDLPYASMGELIILLLMCQPRDFTGILIVTLLRRSSSSVGNNDGISKVRESHVNATSNLLSKLTIYLSKK